MKGYITGVASVLVAMPLIPNHPVWFIVVVVLFCAVILAFWTGLVGIEKTDKFPDSLLALFC